MSLADVSTPVAGAAVAVVPCLLASPYLARLTLTVPDRDAKHWWRGSSAGRRRQVVVGGCAAVLGALAGAAAGLGPLLPAFLALALAGTPLVVIDVEHHRLPNRLTFLLAGAAAALLTMAAALSGDWHSALRGLEAAVVVYLVLVTLTLVSPRSFGYGDVKLGAVLGGYLGVFGWSEVYFGVFGGFLLATLVAVVLLVTGRAGRKTHIPFGPMLVLGALIVLAFDLAPTFG